MSISRLSTPSRPTTTDSVPIGPSWLTRVRRRRCLWQGEGGIRQERERELVELPGRRCWSYTKREVSAQTMSCPRGTQGGRLCGWVPGDGVSRDSKAGRTRGEAAWARARLASSSSAHQTHISSRPPSSGNNPNRPVSVSSTGLYLPVHTRLHDPGQRLQARRGELTSPLLPRLSPP